MSDTTTTNWAFRREVGNALGYTPHPVYAWGWLDSDGVREYPAWDTDLNVAIKLVGTLPLDLSSAPTYGWGDPDNSVWRAEIAWKPESFIAYAATPALAICRAWLAYRAASDPGASAP